jgi:predicted Zn-dependent protease
MIFDRLHELVRKSCAADDYSLFISKRDTLQTRFAQNAITQHMSGEQIKISIHVAYGDQVGAAQINQDDEESVRQAVATAQNIAKLNRPDPEHVASAAFVDLPAVDNYDADTAGLDAKRMVDNIDRCVAHAEARGANLSGFASRTIDERALYTRNGFSGRDLQTYFEHSMTMRKDHVETKTAQGVKRLAAFSLGDMIARLDSQFDALGAPGVFEPCRIPVILRPEAVCNFYQFLTWMMSRRDADDGASPFVDALGTACFGQSFTLRSTLTDPDLVAQRFSGEGIPAQEIEWVRDGVLNQLETDRSYARICNGAPSKFYNVLIEGGDQSDEQMMQRIGRGLIVNRMWYIRTVDARRGEITGMTRDGVLYFEDGKIRGPVNNLRFNEIVHETTRRILALGPVFQVEPNVKAPTVLIDGFNFVDRTSF